MQWCGVRDLEAHCRAMISLFHYIYCISYWYMSHFFHHFTFASPVGLFVSSLGGHQLSDNLLSIATKFTPPSVLCITFRFFL